MLHQNNLDADTLSFPLTCMYTPISQPFTCTANFRKPQRKKETIVLVEMARDCIVTKEKWSLMRRIRKKKEKKKGSAASRLTRRCRMGMRIRGESPLVAHVPTSILQTPNIMFACEHTKVLVM